jgi:membrane-associated phospholipid phosphatase
MNDSPYCSGWSAKRFCAWSIAAAALLGSWIWPASRALWDNLDNACFRTLNATVALGRPFAVVWALTGDRLFDYVAAALTLVFFLMFISHGGRASFRRGIAVGLITTVILLIVIGLQRELIAWGRPSPSAELGDVYSVKDFVSWSRAKESSPNAFPSDHATVMLIMTVLWWRAFGRKPGIIMAALTVAFTLPRMAAGAHWVTDALVGGGFSLFLALAVIDGTPFTGHLYRRARHLIDKIAGWRPPAK